MKKIILVLLSLTIFSCNDGNVSEPIFDFNATISSCGTYILYRTNTDKTEALILNLSESALGTTEGTETLNLGSNNIYYRVFDSAIGSDYFCQDIPPSTPSVLKDLVASSGTITITTTANYENNIVVSYTYDISLENLLFNDGDNSIIYETYDFGSLTLTV